MKIGVVGCAGRMGQNLVREIFKTKGCEFSGGTEGPSNPALGEDVGKYLGLAECGNVITEDTKGLFAESDVVIDFTLPTLTAKHLEFAQKYDTSVILGTTGHDENELLLIQEAANNVAIVKAMNFSIGVNALFALTGQLSNLLDDNYDVEIFEMHHRHKVDAPSGTALALGESVAKGRSVELSDVWVKGRDGITGARKKGEIGFTSLRGGEVVGDHTVIFANDSERIELTHKASSRGIFSKGAVFSALWASEQLPGLYDMLDVLGFEKGS